MRGETIFSKSGPYVFTCSQLVGRGEKKMFRNVVPDFWTCRVAKRAAFTQGRISIVGRVFVSDLFTESGVAAARAARFKEQGGSSCKNI